MIRTCLHALRIWVPMGADEKRPWRVRYLARELPCTQTGAHDVHRTIGDRTWR